MSCDSSKLTDRTVLHQFLGLFLSIWKQGLLTMVFPHIRIITHYLSSYNPLSSFLSNPPCSLFLIKSCPSAFWSYTCVCVSIFLIKDTVICCLSLYNPLLFLSYWFLLPYIEFFWLPLPSSHVHACLCMCRSEEDVCVSCSIFQHLISLRQNPLLNLELSWWPASPSEPLVSAPHSAGVTGVHSHGQLFMWLLGSQAPT